MRTSYRIAPSLLLLLISGVPAAAGEQAYAAMIDRVQCQAILKEKTGAEIHLAPIDHAARRLAPGESVRCASPGSLTLLLGNREITVKQGTEKIQAADPSAHKDEKDELAIDALAYHNSPAGTRGMSGRILFPTADSVVWPQDFVIYWRPLREGNVTFSLHAPNSNQPLWQSGEINGNTGSLDSPELKQKVASYRDSSPQSSKLVLEGQTPSGGFTIPFSLLSRDDEKKLADELQVWSQTNNELLQAVGRAYSFASRNLFREAAQQYAQALKIAPGSCDLLRESEAVEEEANNWPRAEQLEGDLESAGCSAREH